MNNPDTSSEHFHGSDLQKVEAKYHIKASDIISFSANVNPLGLSDKLKAELSSHLDCLTAYPDREYTALRNVIADYCGCNADHVVVGNGSSELISLFIRALAPKKSLILGPTYSEYMNEAKGAGSEASYFELKESEGFVLDEAALISALADDTSLLVICNPNNPTGGAIRRSVLDRIAQHCRSIGCFVLIDETYVEFASDMDDITAVPLAEKYTNLALLRGVSKFYSSPGLRLGYALCSDTGLRQRISMQQVPWSINSLAEVAGRLMFTDTAFQQQTRDLIFSERKRLTKRLSENPLLKVYPSDSNFILVKLLTSDVTAASLFDAAMRLGMMIRDCSTFCFLDESFFRFCIMDPSDNDRLMECIEKCLSK